jgi:hypothetical protein
LFHVLLPSEPSWQRVHGRRNPERNQQTSEEEEQETEQQDKDSLQS